MYMTTEDMQYIRNITNAVYESEEAPNTNTASNFRKLVNPNNPKPYLYFSTDYECNFMNLLDVLKSKCTQSAIVDTIHHQRTPCITQHMVVVDWRKIPISSTRNLLLMIVPAIAAKQDSHDLEGEIDAIAEQIVSVAAKFMRLQTTQWADTRVSKTLILDELWPAFMVLQNIAGIKDPTQMTKNMCQFYLSKIR